MSKVTSDQHSYGTDSYFTYSMYHYAEMPIKNMVVLSFHNVMGGICMLFGALQFWLAFRHRYPPWHRGFGALYMVTAQLAMIAAAIYLTITPVQTFYDSFSFYVGLWILVIIVTISLWLSIYHLKRKEYAQHQAYMAINFGALLTAPILRYNWVLGGILFPDVGFNTSNYLGAGILLPQCFVMGYLLLSGIMAGSPCPREIMQRVIDRIHMSEITICYGMTETSPVSIQSSVSDTIDKRVSSVGHVHPHVEIKIVDPEGQRVPQGTLGELCVRGYSVMAGYWGEEEKTREVIDAAGWMHTGDIAKIDAEGFVKIKGRIKDVVIRGGENLFPKEIEDFLYTHPAICDVQVIGLPDTRYGEELCACIILHEHHQTDEDNIRSFCKEHISHNKVPRYVKFFNEFPVTASGKAQKFKLQEIMRADLNLT